MSYIDGAMWVCLCLHMKAKEREAFRDNDGMGTHDYKGQKSMRIAEKMMEKREEGSPFLCPFFIAISESLENNKQIELVGALAGHTE